MFYLRLFTGRGTYKKAEKEKKVEEQKNTERSNFLVLRNQIRSYSPPIMLHG